MLISRFIVVYHEFNREFGSLDNISVTIYMKTPTVVLLGGVVLVILNF